MTIIYTDGGQLEASEIKIDGTTLIVDDIYFVDIEEVETIEE